jgi:hypothetical protein
MALIDIRDSLGDDNAESEPQLAQIFIRTGDYQRVESNIRSLVLGGRGAGKSAICRMLESVEAHPDTSSQRSAQWVTSLSSDTASWGTLERVAKSLDNDANSISRQWEFTVLLQCFEVAIKGQLPKNPKKRQMARQLDNEITKFLDRDRVTSVREGRLSYIVDAAVAILQKLPFRFVMTTPFAPVGIEIAPTDSRDVPPLTAAEVDQRRIALVEGLYGVLKDLIPSGTTLRVLIDQLDDDWKARSQQTTSLVGLFSALMRMHRNLRAADLTKSVRVIVFLRTDIYEFLKQNGLDDATKFAQHELHLRWNVESLRSMLDRRIQAANQPEFESLRSLFSQERLGGRPLDEYLLTIAAPRPRDVIHFLRTILDNATGVHEDGHEGEHERVTKDDVEKAESDYSGWRRGVIVEESRYTVPDLEVVLDSFRGKTPNYSPRELRRHLDNVKREGGVSMTKPKLIEALVDWGVIGVQSRDRGRRFVWDLPEGQWFGPDESGSEESGESWVIHQALWKVLSLRRKRTAKKAAS